MPTAEPLGEGDGEGNGEDAGEGEYDIGLSDFVARLFSLECNFHPP